MRENRTHGSEGGDGESRFRPLSKSPVGEHKIMNHFVVQGLFLFRLRLCHVCLCGEYPASLTLTCRIRLCKKGAVVIPLLRS